MLKIIQITIFLLNFSQISLAGGMAGGGPGTGPGSMANCFQDSTFLFDSSTPQGDLTINPLIYGSEEFFKPSASTYDTKGLVGFVEPTVFDSLKYSTLVNQNDVLVNVSADLKSLVSSSTTTKVDYLNYYDNPDEIEIVLKNNSSIHIAPMPESEWNDFIKDFQKSIGDSGDTSSSGCPSQSELIDYYTSYFGQK